MIPMTINFNGDGALADIPPEQIRLPKDGATIQAIVLEQGMASGRPSVAIVVEMPDGTRVVAQTSARLFCTAGRAIAARYPTLFEGD